jgi:hypothetical protein
MKRLLIAAAVVALATPATASAATNAGPIPPCPNDNLTYCVGWWVDQIFHT